MVVYVYVVCTENNTAIQLTNDGRHNHVKCYVYTLIYAVTTGKREKYRH